MEKIIIESHNDIAYVQYSPLTDVAEVSQNGFVDLVTAFANNSIPSNIEGVEENFNNIEEPGNILRKPKDVFDAMQLRQTISDYSGKSEEVEQS